ncbi:MAG: cyclodeaminase/cyclohydrolase family protein [Marmoricola sp.]
MAAPYFDHSVAEFLDLVARRSPAPGGGGAAALTVSLAASLVAMAARYSSDLSDAGERLVEEAERLRADAAGLADDDAEAYGAVIAVYAKARDAGSTDREELRRVLTRAAEVPLQIVEIGAETARLAALLATEGKRDVRGDATTALLLAEAATRSAAYLVAVNVGSGGEEEALRRRATDGVTSASASVRRGTA